MELEEVMEMQDIDIEDTAEYLGPNSCEACYVARMCLQQIENNRNRWLADTDRDGRDAWTEGFLAGLQIAIVELRLQISKHYNSRRDELARG